MKLYIAAAALLTAFLLPAQNYRLPDRHAESHNRLLASQGNAGITVDNTTKYLEELLYDEEEPEFDIYEEGWDSRRVNCYANTTVPQRAVIDVSKFAMPHPGYITSPYGYRRRFRRMHKGVDLKLNIGDMVIDSLHSNDQAACAYATSSAAATATTSWCDTPTTSRPSTATSRHSASKKDSMSRPATP